MFVSSDFSFVKFDGRRKAKSVTVQSGCGVYRLGVRTNLAYHHDDPGSNGLATTQNGKYRGSIIVKFIIYMYLYMYSVTPIPDKRADHTKNQALE